MVQKFLVLPASLCDYREEGTYFLWQECASLTGITTLVGLCVYSYASVLAVTKPVHDAISKLNNSKPEYTQLPSV